MRDLCTVSRIDKLIPIENKQYIELATVNNYTVIVTKGDFKVGDLCIYCFYDTICPNNKMFEHLKKYCHYSTLYDGYRITEMKMAGVFSSGIIFGLDIVDKKYHKLGTDLTEILGIQRYDPEEKKEVTSKKQNKLLKFLMRYKFFRRLRKLLFGKKVSKVYPLTVHKSNETNVETNFNKLPKDHEYYLTEKLEGQAGCWLIKGRKNKFMQFSHNVYRDMKENNTWTKVNYAYDLEEILKKHYKETKTRIAIQGEICGPGIQRNVYGFKELKLFVYKVTNVDNGKAFNYNELNEFCDKYLLTIVPKVKISNLLNNVDEMLLDCEGASVFKNNGKSVKREGIVWRSTKDQSIGCKCKSRDYKIWFYKKDKVE